MDLHNNSHSKSAIELGSICKALGWECDIVITAHLRGEEKSWGQSVSSRITSPIKLVVLLRSSHLARPERSFINNRRNVIDYRPPSPLFFFLTSYQEMASACCTQLRLAFVGVPKILKLNQRPGKKKKGTFFGLPNKRPCIDDGELDDFFTGMRCKGRNEYWYAVISYERELKAISC